MLHLKLFVIFVYNNDKLRYNVVMMNEKHIKYPRTYHLPCSLTVTDDDMRLKSDEHFASMREVVVSKFNEFKTRKIDDVEGFVVRNADRFTFNEFAQNVGKYVRANHVLTDENWDCTLDTK